MVCAITEDRLNRIKHYYGFPCRAIEKVLEYCGITSADVDIFALSTHSVFYPTHAHHFRDELDGSLLPAAPERGLWGFLRKGGVRAAAERVIRDNAEALAQKKAKRMEEVRANWGEFAPRHWVMQEDFLREVGLLDERIAHYYVHHHRAHAASAYRLAGFEDACVISIDGKGDGVSAAIFRGEQSGDLALLRTSKKEDSLGSFYQAITEALGFIPADGEYKTMGLAALGDPDGGPNPFAGTVRVVDGVLRSKIAWEFRDYNKHNPERRVANPLSSVSHADEYRKVLDRMPREQFAYFAQEHFQENMLAFARDALQVTGKDRIAAAGGVMLNVKANGLIRSSLAPREFFVFPDSSDSGLAIGAALEALHQAGALAHGRRLETPYLGHDHSEESLDEFVARARGRRALAVREAEHEALAGALLAGRVIGTFRGRMEIGPRALGNRSVLADSRSVAVKDRINALLKGREWFVPFAPVVLDSDAHLYWEGSIDYPYMTFAVRASDYAKRTVPAVVHVDGTMRPQVVRHDTNPWLHELLRRFKAQSGVGVLINTSFNRHGLPMVGAPEDALDHLLNGWVDALLIGRWYVERG